MSNAEVLLKIAGITIVWVLVMFTVTAPKHTTSPAILRSLLRRRMKSHGTPRLCAYHVTIELRVGQMARIDSANCEICNKNK